MKKRVCCLYRVSTKGQVEKDDIPMQKQVCHEFAESNGWEVTEEFSEKRRMDSVRENLDSLHIHLHTENHPSILGEIFLSQLPEVHIHLF